MLLTLPARIRAFVVLLLTALAAVPTAEASHLLGGDITYVYLGNNGPSNAPYRYRITLKAYVDGTPPSNFFQGNLGNNATLGIYNMTTNGLIQTISIPSTPGAAITQRVQIPVANGCTVSISDTAIRIFLNTFTTEINLPFSLKGYKAVYSSFARSAQIQNLALTTNGGGPTNGASFVANIPSPLTPNSSPQFFDNATTFICRSDTVTLANSARDPDGDRLIYSFVKPLDGVGNGGGPPPTTYTAPNTIGFDSLRGFTLTEPFGPGGVAEINSASGFTRYHAPNVGAYVVAFEIKEYRTLSSGRDTLLSTTRREVQILIRDCLPNNPPTANNGSPTGPVQTAYTITEGESLTFNVGATDSDTMTLSAEADIIQGTGGYTGPRATLPTVTAPGSVSSTFTWQTTCGVRGTFPVNVKVVDKGCPPKTTAAVYLVTVLPFTAPKTLAAGEDSACGSTSTYTYSVNSTAPNGQFKWVVTGGTIVGSNIGKSVTVKWTPTTSLQTAFLRVVQTSTVGGCKDSTTFPIKIFPLFPLVTINPASFNLCQGDTAVLRARGGFGNYRWTDIGGGAPVGLSSAIDSIVRAFPTATQTYVVSSTILPGCTVKDTIRVRFVPDVARAGADSVFCSGFSATIGSDSVAGYNYSWTPTTGVQLPNRSRTKVTLRNGLQIDTVYTFVQTAIERASSCTSTDTVSIRVRPLPIVNAGPDTATFCSGSTIQLPGTSSMVSRFKWQVVNGALFSVMPPTDTTSTATVTGRTPDHFTVVRGVIRLTATNRETGCKGSDSINIRINPLPLVSFSPQDSACAGTTLTLGQPAFSGYIYDWSVSPNLAISDTAAAQPIVTYPTAYGDTATVYTAQVRIVNQYGCAKDSSQTIRRNNLPRINAGADKAFCSGDSITVGGLPRNLRYGYLWSNLPGFSMLNIAQPRYTHTNTPPGSQDVHIKLGLLGTNLRTTCQATDTIVVTVHSRPVVQAALTDTLALCNRDSIQIGTPGRASQSYVWQQLPTSLSIPQPRYRLDTTSAQPQFVSLGNWTNNVGAFYPYHFQLRAKNDSTGCTALDTLVIRLNPTPSLFPVVTGDRYPYVDSICSGGQGRIAHFDSLAGRNPSFAIHWSSGRGFNVADTASFGPGYQFSLPTPGAPAEEVRYPVRVAYTNTGCADTASVKVVVKPIPVALAGSDLAVCSRASLQVGLPAVPGRAYAWSPRLGLNDTAVAQPNFSLNNPTQRDSVRRLVMQIFDTGTLLRCSNADTINVTVHALPLAKGGPDHAVCSRLMVQIGEAPDTLRQYAWSPALGLSDTAISQPVFTMVNPTQRDSVRTLVLQVTETLTPERCVNRDTVRVTVHPLPIANAGADVAVCSEGTVQIGSASVPNRLYAWTPNVYLNDTSLAQPNFSLNNPTQHDSVRTFQVLVTETATAERCQNIDSIRVTVRPLPIIQAGSDLAVCSEAPLQVGLPPVANQTYAWSPRSVLNDSTLAQPTFTLNNPTQRDSIRFLVLRGTETVTAERCSNTDTIRVTVRPLPIAQAGPDTAAVCSGLSLSLGTDSTTGYNYAWTPATDLSSAAVSNPTLTTTASPTRHVVYRVLVTNTTTTCQKSDSIRIRVNALPAVALGSARQTCANQPVGLGVFTADSARYTYNWFPNGGLNSTTVPRPVFQAPVAVGYIIHLRVTEIATGCTNLDSLTMTVNPLPQVNAGNDTSYCADTQVQVATTSQTGYSYAWSTDAPGSLTTPTQASTAFSYPNTTQAPITTWVRVTTTIATTTCKATDSLRVTTNPRPLDAVFTPSTRVVCPGTQNQPFSVTPRQAGYTYNWTVGSTGTIASGQGTDTIRVNWGASANNIPVTVVASNSYGCTQRGTSTFNVTVNPILHPQQPVPVSGLTALCYNTAADRYATITSPNSTYTWRYQYVGQPGVTLPATRDTASVRWPSTGVVRVWVDEISTPPASAQCFGSSDTLLVRINASPDTLLPVVGPLGLCQFTPGTFSLAGRDSSTYRWQIFPVGSTDTVAFNGQGRDSINTSFAAAGNYTVNGFETTNRGCPGKLRTLSLTVNPKPVPTTNAPAFVCSNQTDVNFAVNPGQTGSSFTWLPAGGPSVSAGQGSPQITLTLNGQPLQGLRVVESSSFGCVSDTLAVPFNVDNSRVELLSVSTKEDDDSKVLIRLRVLDNALQTDPSAIERADNFGGFTAIGSQAVTTSGQVVEFEDASPSPTTSSVNRYRISLTNKCNLPVRSAEHATMVLTANAVEATSTANLNWTPYEGFTGLQEYELLRQNDGEAVFSPLAELPIVAAPATTASPKVGGDAFKQAFRIKATDANTGEVSYSNIALLSFENVLVFYNIVTPNGDDKNDDLQFKNLSLYPGNNLKVYNRWGRKVYEASNYQGGYAPEEAGVYTYIFTTADGKATKGWFEVMK